MSIDIEIPEENSNWKHKGGNIYRVLIVANKASERLDEYPITVVYQRLVDKTVWSRPLTRWHGSFERIEEEEFKHYDFQDLGV